MSSRPEEAQDPLVGRTLGDFVVEERIGEGSFGAVYRARQPLLGRLAALKVLHTRLSRTADATDRFLREARTASSLDHPYAAHIYSSGAEPDGTLWIAMEYVRGTPFSEYLRAQGPLPPERFVPFLERVCEVVHSAHEEGIVHRDIKPANIMVLSRSGRLLPKLLDFGIAKAIAHAAGTGEAAGEEHEAGPDGTSELSSLAETVPPASSELAATAQRGSGPASPWGGGASSPRSGAEPGAGDLTRRGELIGSPYYMAPEQWDDAASVDSRTDLYALGIVAYEALTGDIPYPGRNMREVARGHRSGEPPPVPEVLPRELDQVFGRALAKAPASRFESALHLGEALRRAAGLGAESPPLPRLDEPLRERFFAEAPQPVAEAVATLDAAREPRQARDALWAVSDTLAHYLGLLALCAHSRFRSPGGSALPPALRRAGVELLSADDWLEVGEALAHAGAERPELHPVPEIVYFFGADRAGEAEGLARFRELRRLREPLASASAGDEALRRTLAEATAALSALLRRAEFLCDYPLVLPDDDGEARALTGLGRSSRPGLRPTLRIRGRPSRAGEPVLLDAEGAPVLALHPLVQMLSPAPDAPAEIFFFAGSSERGGKLVAKPHPFERHDPEIVDWLRLQLETTLESKQGAGEQERSPYRGLEAYGPGDASLYVGREREVDALANRLRMEPLLAVVGPSGAGKSSFVHAGVIPALKEGEPSLRAVTLRPGPAPLAALASRLSSAGFAAAGLGTRLRREPELLGELLREEGARAPLVIVVDQFEELFTLTQNDHEREAFAAALSGAARAAEDPVRVIVTLRDDFLVRAESMAPFRSRLAQALHLLTSPGRAELERILVEPAARVGYEFEDPELPARMVAEVEGEPGALPLLSFTAALLWDARDRHFHRIPTRAYEELGGVGGALAHHAEGLLESLPQTERRLVREAFRLLVTSEGTRAILGRKELHHALGGTPEADAALEHLINGRLLVVSDGEEGEQIEVAHEALLTAWPRLVEWRREDVEGARLRDQLRAAALQWDRRGRPKGLLWRDDALAEYRIWRSRYPGVLTGVEEDFGRESLAEARRGQRRRRIAVGGAFAALSVGLALLFGMSQRAEQARAAAEEQRAVAEEQRALADERRAEIRDQLLDSYLEQGSRALRNHRYYHALLYLAEALEMGANGPEEAFMLAMAKAPFEARRATARHDGSVWDVAFGPEGETLAVASSTGSAYLRDAGDGALERELKGHSDEVFRVAWHPSGELLATGSWDGSVNVWDPGSGELLETWEQGEERVISLAFDASGGRLFSGTVAGRVRVLDVHREGQRFGGDPESEVVIDAHRGPVWQIEVSPEDEFLATASSDGRIRLWDPASGRSRGALEGHGARVDVLRFAPSGEWLLSTSHDGTARTWRPESGELIAELEGHDARVQGGDVGPAGERVATASRDGTARLWDPKSGRQLALLEGHEGRVGHVAFRPDGEEVLTSGADGTARLWDARTGALVAILPGDVRPIGRAHYGPGGKRIATTGSDGTVAIWNVDEAGFHRSFDHHEAQVASVSYSESGERLVTASGDGSARVWEGEGGELVGALPHPEPVMDADMAPGGTEVVTVGESGHVRLWEVEGEKPRATLGESDPIRDRARFGPEGEVVVVSGENAGVYDASKRRQIFELDVGDARITAVDMSRDGRRILAGTSAGRGFVFDGDSGELLRELVGHERWILSIRASPQGHVVATTSADGSARLWDPETGEALAVLSGHQDAVRDADFSADGTLVATAGADQLIRVWGVDSGRQLARLPGHRRDVSGVSFAPGYALASSSDDGTFRLWRLERGGASEEELETLTRCLPLELSEGNPLPRSELPDEC